MNLVEKAVKNGGKLAPIVIPDARGSMNPSIFIDDDGDILVNVRCVNYTLYHSENNQRFPSPWGPLAYLHPEKDQRLVTENYIAKLDADLNLTHSTKVEMLNLHQPIWEFVGLEDARLVQWHKSYYLVGVRRDTTTNGQGRMEYSRIVLDKDNWTAQEVSRTRIPAPDDSSYCEKNWYPILDQPYNFIKWSCPTEIVFADPDVGTSHQVALHPTPMPSKDQRGSSHMVRWGEYYISITHEVDLFKNYLDQKDAIYRHRLLVWDTDIKLLGMSEPFSFLDACIEFCVGAAVYQGDLLISWAFQDNAAFVLATPRVIIDELIREALDEH